MTDAFCLYGAVDSEGNTIDSLLCAKHASKAAKRSFCKALKATHIPSLRVTSVDGNPAYPGAFEELKDEEILPETCTPLIMQIFAQYHRAGSLLY